MNRMPPKKVKHIESGLCFSSMGKAARYFKISQSTISNHCRGNVDVQKFCYCNDTPKGNNFYHNEIRAHSIVETLDCGLIEVLDIQKNQNNEYICKIRFLKSGSYASAMLENIKLGNVEDPSIPNICGVAFATPHLATKHKREYSLWKGILYRCYGSGRRKNVKRVYGGVTVCNRWLSFRNFLEDIPNLNGYELWRLCNNMHIDKDILSGSTKVYSPKTCHFVTPQENSKHVKRFKVSKPVMYIPTGEKFSSIKSAAEAKGLKSSTVSAHCRGRMTSSSSKFKFMFLNPLDGIKNSNEKIHKKIQHIETGGIFDNVIDAAKGIERDNIENILRVAEMGIVWRFVDEE